ncbi:hypothetical protein [Pseudalkalibacillus sp. SCS-8]|uniref:hypothetical protein n=1 Tax=Pseudalkalibacillus nanhaiensis TaxID=3115291 RepID=UPI0032DA5A2F
MKLRNGIIILLLLTNLLAVYFIWTDEDDHSSYLYAYLEGESEHWKLDDHHVFYSPEEMSEGDGILTYTKDSNGAMNILYEVTFYDKQNKSYFSSKGSTFESQGHLGGIRNEVFGGKKNEVPSIEEIESVYAIIKWNGKEERMDLQLKDPRKH